MRSEPGSKQILNRAPKPGVSAGARHVYTARWYFSAKHDLSGGRLNQQTIKTSFYWVLEGRKRMSSHSFWWGKRWPAAADCRRLLVWYVRH